MRGPSLPCPCGSSKPSLWACDARGIELCRTCDDCHDEKMARYRPDVLANPSYEADEDIEPDDWDERAQDQCESALYWHGR